MPLKKISLIISIIGIIILFILSLTLQPKLSKIYELETKLNFEHVKVQAQFVSQKELFSNKTNSTFNIIKIKDSSGTIQVITNESTSFKKNQTIEVQGKINNYNGKNQIQAEKINKIN